MERNPAPRMSNTAEIIIQHFKSRRSSDSNSLTSNDDQVDHCGSNRKKSTATTTCLKSKINEEFSTEGNRISDDEHQKQKDALFFKYLTRLQHNFFVLLLMLNTIFNSTVIVVGLLNKSDDKYPGISFLYFTSLIVFCVFLAITIIDEHLMRPKFSRRMASITVLLAMIFTEYANELLQLNHITNYNSLQRIRPIIYIIIAAQLLLPFSSSISSLISSIIIIFIEISISLYQRLNICNNRNIVIRLIVSDLISYLYAAIFGLYMSRLLQKIIRRAFGNYYDYIRSKFKIHQEQEKREQLLQSCLPKHLIDDVKHDLKEVLDNQNPVINQKPFKKLYVDKHDNVSILYADIVNSMLLTTNLNPNELVETLDAMFGSFDASAERNKCFRIKLLGDCYYCVSGLFNDDPNHAWNCLQMGLEMIKIIRKIRKSKKIDVDMRIGIHSGMVLSGIIGVHKWQFDIWSLDTILASQMEHDGVPGCVHITRETLDLLPKDKLNNYNIKEKMTNERIGYLITKKRKKVSLHDDVKINCSLEEIKINPDNNNDNDNNDDNDNNNKFQYFHPEKFSKSNPFIDNDSLRENRRELKKVQKLIDQEIEQMPLSFRKNFNNFYGINPVTLTFQTKKSNNNKKQKTNTSNDDVVSTTTSSSSSSSSSSSTDDSVEKNWQLEKEFLTQPDDFFLYYLLFELFLCITIGLNKCVLIPKLHLNSITLIIQLSTIVIIFISIIFYYKNRENINFLIRYILWLLISLLILINSLHDLILFPCQSQKELIIQTSLNEYDSATCPYVWSYTMSSILSMTGISIFLTVNSWFKFILRMIGMICFMIILLNDCSIYQSIIKNIQPHRQWISNIGFDPILSHFYYMLMAVVILTIIDRQIEHIFRLDFKLLKRLQKEKKDAKIMAEINEILLKATLPSNLAVKYMEQNPNFINRPYSEQYQFCVVMFASIPNYWDFYSENEVNRDGGTCLQLLNEIICDFDSLLSSPHFEQIEKIKTIGSTYMAAAGLQPGRGSVENESICDGEKRKHVMTMVHFVMALMETLRRINKSAIQDFKIRVGIAVGPVIAGIVGASKPQYDIWGDTVNVASRMDSCGVMGRIQITQETGQIILTNDDYQNHFQLEQRGPIEVKGKGNLTTYLVKTQFDFEENEITRV